MIIAFQTPQIDIRGTCVALYDYALYNETILGNKSIIFTDNQNTHKNDIVAVIKFTKRFPVIFYNDKNDMYKQLKNKKCNMVYTIKYGKKDKMFFEDIKTVVHCVFDLSEPHGDVYAAVSKTLAKKYNHHLYVPHMIGLQPFINRDDMRKSLNIPKTDIVFGRHGGKDTFNLSFVHEAIKEIVNENSNIWFVFMGAPRFAHHSKIIYLPIVSDNEEKNRFIQTCDAYIEASNLGHSFGLSIGEFSVNNKPIIAYYGPVWNTSHYEILGNNALYFTNKEEFKNIITTFNPKNYKNKNLNCYEEYSPEKVMTIFKDVFIDEKITKNVNN